MTIAIIKVCNIISDVVAQLVEWSLLRPEVQGSNPVMGEILNRTFVYVF